MKLIRNLVFFAALIGASAANAQQANPFASVLQFCDESVANQAVAGGTILVYHQGKPVLSHAFGYTDLASQTPFEVDTPVVIASISKPLIGTALYRLVDQEKLDVDIPISEYLPEFEKRKLESGDALRRAPTMTELLTHTSGMIFDEAKGGRIWFQKWTRGQSLEYVVKKLGEEFPFKVQPGSKYAYSGVGTDVAARVGEVISGLPRNQMILDYLAEPLGMSNTFYRDKAGIAKRQLAMPTRYYRDKNTGKLRARKKTATPTDNAYSASGGSVISTAPDLLKWLLMIRQDGVLANGDVFLTAESMAAMLTQQPGSYNAKGGLFVRRKDSSGRPAKYAHTGSSGTSIWIDVEHDVVGIILTQTRGSDIREFRLELEKQIAQAISSASPTDK